MASTDDDYDSFEEESHEEYILDKEMLEDLFESKLLDIFFSIRQYCDENNLPLCNKDDAVNYWINEIKKTND